MRAEGHAPNSSTRLDSWKEIAAYLGKAIRTVQRWERSEGLPVHRFGQDRTGPVFAYKSEIDVWWQQQSRRLLPEPEPEADCEPDRDLGQPAAPPAKRWLLLAAGFAVLLLCFAFAARALRPAGATYRPVPFTTEHGWEVQPDFSPDGHRIAYVAKAIDTPTAIYVKGVGADSATRLTSSTMGETFPAWSPDGRLIAFYRFRPPTGRSLLLIPPTGGPETQVAEIQSGGKLVWSTDGRWIITTEDDNRRRVLIAIAVATGEKHRLTEPVEFSFCGYGLSPDLRRIIYCRGGPGPSTIWERDLTEALMPVGDARVLVPNVWLSEMVLANDAKTIFYSDTDYVGVGLWRRRLSPAAQPELIYGGSGNFATPAVSPDQHRLVFAVSPSIHEETFRLDLDDVSAKPSPILSTTHSDLNPDFSPDGRYIAFHSTRSGASEIWVADRNGTNPRRLTFTNARITATPRWSPDGAWIAYESNGSGQSEVYVVRSNGGPARQLTQNPATDAIPSWSRDGKTIYFCSNRTGRFEIWNVPLMGGAPTQVTRDGGFAAVESTDGNYLYYSQNRNYGPVWRQPLPHGQAEMIIPELRGIFFAVAASGVYYQTSRTILFWDAATKQTREVLSTPKAMGIGLAVSSDAKDLLFTQVDPMETDLYLIDLIK